MMLNKKTRWIVLTMLIALAAAGGLMAWAAPPGGKDSAEQTAAQPAGPNSDGVVVAQTSVPASTPRKQDQRVALDAELIGTAVVEGGTSYAVFQLAGGPRFVREGDEIAGGVHLVKVSRNRIDVESNGVHEAIRLGSGERIRHQVRPGSIRGPVTEAEVDRLRELRTQKFMAAMEMRARQVQ